MLTANDINFEQLSLNELYGWQNKIVNHHVDELPVYIKNSRDELRLYSRVIEAIKERYLEVSRLLSTADFKRFRDGVAQGRYVSIHQNEPGKKDIPSLLNKLYAVCGTAELKYSMEILISALSPDDPLDNQILCALEQAQPFGPYGQKENTYVNMLAQHRLHRPIRAEDHPETVKELFTNQFQQKAHSAQKQLYSN